jgi:hypothetical protein
MTEKEYDSLGDLATIVTFTQSISVFVPLPTVNPTKKTLFTGEVLDLDIKIESLKDKLDLGEFCIPISNLLEPKIAAGALKALDKFIQKKRAQNSEICTNT